MMHAWHEDGPVAAVRDKLEMTGSSGRANHRPFTRVLLRFDLDFVRCDGLAVRAASLSGRS